MMYLIHVDESAIQVLITARLSHLFVPFLEKLDNLLDRLNNRRAMYDFQCNERACGRMGIKMASVTVAP
jgi:hypothetical protein